MPWAQALEIASRVTHPIAAALIGLVFSAFLFIAIIMKRRSRITWLLAIMVLCFGLAPLLSQTYLQSQNLYRVRVTVLGVNKQPVENATVSSSIGGEGKRIAGGLEFDIPPQSKPADGRLTFYASVKEAFLEGEVPLVLDKEYFPTVAIQLIPDTSAVVLGRVVDGRGRSVERAQVSVSGYQSFAVSDTMGNFRVPAHTAEGQMVRLHAQKGKLVADIWVPAGNHPQRVEVK